MLPSCQLFCFTETWNLLETKPVHSAVIVDQYNMIQISSCYWIFWSQNSQNALLPSVWHMHGLTLLFGCRTCFLVLFLFNLKNFWFCDCNIGKYYSCWNKFWHPCGLPRSSLEKYLTRWPLDHFRSSYQHSKKNKQNITHSSLFCSQSQNYGSHRCFPQLKKIIFLIYQQHKVYIFIFCLSPSEFFTSKSLMSVNSFLYQRSSIFFIYQFLKRHCFFCSA